MSMADEAQIEQVSVPSDLKLSDIEKGFSALWNKTAGEAGETAVTRVCTMSLIVHLPGRSSLDPAMDAVRVASLEHPLRAVFLLAEPGETDIKGNISGYCQVAQGGDLQVCCEEIVLTATGEAAQNLPSAAIDLLVPDLPVALWWVGEPQFGTEMMDRLRSVSDNLIVDSHDFADALRDMKQLAANIGRQPHAGVSDVNWSRITQWREQVADLFDDPTARSHIGRIESLHIDYAGDTDPSQAILFAGWFGERLDWSRSSGPGDMGGGKFASVVTNTSRKEIELKISPTGLRQVAEGNIVAVEIEAGDGAFTFRVASEDERMRLEVRAQAEGMNPVHRTSALEAQRLGVLLGQEIEQFGLGISYAETLRAGLAYVDRAP